MKGHIQKRGSSYRVLYYFKGKQISKSFRSYHDAETFKASLVVKEAEGILDPRDYAADNPLGFENKVREFLETKRLLKGVKKYEQRLRFTVAEWGNRNVKTIGYGDISELLVALESRGLSSKYRKDIRDTIRMLFRWLWQYGEINYDQIPRMPKIRVSMSYRRIVDKETQQGILAEIQRITGFNPRIYIAVLFLCTYINIRPGELIQVKEKDIDFVTGRILVPSKTGGQKYVYLVANDRNLLASYMSDFPHNYFFRHIKGRGGNKPGTKFGKGYLYKWWKKACENLGITGVDLYGGTRHSSAIALRQKHSPEAVRRATGHATNEAFERYLQIQESELRVLYADTRGEIKEFNHARNKI